MRQSLLIFFFLIISSLFQAAEIRVKSFSMQLEPMTVPMQRKDFNGQICALVKVPIPIAGVKFEGNVVEVIYDVNEYWVYLTPGTKHLSIKCPNYTPLRVDFTKFNDIEHLTSKSIYSLDLETEDREQPVFKGRPGGVTPRLAGAFQGLDASAVPGGFSEGMMVVSQPNERISLISTEGSRIELSDASVGFPPLYNDGLLAVRINDQVGFINKAGVKKIGFGASGNKVFKDPRLKLGPLRYGFSVMFEDKGDGRRGIINKNGETILSLTSKYKGIKVFDGYFIMWDEKSIYKWPSFTPKSSIPDKEYIFKLTDYSGYIGDVEEDYILINDIHNCLVYIYSFDSRDIEKIKAKLARSIDSSHILYEDEQGWWYIYRLPSKYSKTTTTRRLPTKEFVSVVGTQKLFDGQTCYSLSGDTIFSLPRRVEFSRAGFHDGFMLVKEGDTYRYIDEKGKSLNNSEFKLAGRADSFLLTCPRPFAEGFGLIMRNGEWGLIDKFGTTTFDYQ